MNLELITDKTNTFDRLINRPDKPTSQEISDIVTPKPQTVVNENNVVFGYVNTSDLTKFWADSSYTLEIECADGFVYLARNNNKSYRWNGTTLIRVDYENPQDFLDVYSTTEQRVGTWTDGKALYRRVVTGTTPSAVNTWATAVTVSGASYIKILQADVGRKTTTTVERNTIPDTNVSIGVKGNTILAYVKDTEFVSKTLSFIIIYTK